jgi:hypothetical protein
MGRFAFLGDSILGSLSGRIVSAGSHSNRNISSGEVAEWLKAAVC